MKVYRIIFKFQMTFILYLCVDIIFMSLTPTYYKYLIQKIYHLFILFLNIFEIKNTLINVYLYFFFK